MSEYADDSLRIGGSRTGTVGQDGVGSESAMTEGKLRAGAKILHFTFNSALIASGKRPEWYFSPILQCGELVDETTRMMKVQLNPAEFEPSHASFRLEAGQL